MNFFKVRYFSQNISLSEREGEWAVSKSYWGMIISLALCFCFSIYKIVNSDVFSPRNLMHFELIYLKNFAKKRIMNLLTASILISVFLQFICHLCLISVLFFAILFWTVISPVEKSPTMSLPLEIPDFHTAMKGCDHQEHILRYSPE